MDERFLFELFKDVGNVIGVKIKRDAASGKASTCYGFIDFRTHESAAQALRDYNGKLIPGTAKYVPVVYLQTRGLGFEAEFGSPEKHHGASTIIRSMQGGKNSQ